MALEETRLRFNVRQRKYSDSQLLVSRMLKAVRHIGIMALAAALETFWRSSTVSSSIGVGLEATAVPGLCSIKGNREDALPNSTLRAIATLSVHRLARMVTPLTPMRI
ncbi:hypothetical protein E4U45_004041 [Claviceps purpurea]|nr:hypothetical protein E4U45_004041 [Claviceps purpurea]